MTTWRSMPPMSGRPIPCSRASQRYGAEMVVLWQTEPGGEAWSIDWGLYGTNRGRWQES